MKCSCLGQKASLLLSSSFLQLNVILSSFASLVTSTVFSPCWSLLSSFHLSRLFHAHRQWNSTPFIWLSFQDLLSVSSLVPTLILYPSTHFIIVHSVVAFEEPFRRFAFEWVPFLVGSSDLLELWWVLVKGKVQLLRSLCWRLIVWSCCFSLRTGPLPVCLG